MFNSPIEAGDEMRQLFKDGWAALTIVDPTPEIRWHGKEKKTDPIPETYFTRFVIRPADTQPAGYMENGEGPSDQVFDTIGTVFAQVFAPVDAVDSYRQGELLAIAARDIFLGVQTISGVWFKNARYVEVGDDGKFYIWNVIAEYEFSES